MGIWREPMFARAATTKGVGEKVAGFLESCGLRCSKCRKWCDGRTFTVDKGVVSRDDAGGLLLMDPLYVKDKVCKCQCGHTMFTRTIFSPFA